MVSQYWNGNDWDWDSIQPYLFYKGCRLVKGVVLVSDVNAMDKVAWKATPSG